MWLKNEKTQHCTCLKHDLAWSSLPEYALNQYSAWTRGAKGPCSPPPPNKLGKKLEKAKGGGDPLLRTNWQSENRARLPPPLGTFQNHLMTEWDNFLGNSMPSFGENWLAERLLVTPRMNSSYLTNQKNIVPTSTDCWKLTTLRKMQSDTMLISSHWIAQVSQNNFVLVTEICAAVPRALFIWFLYVVFSVFFPLFLIYVYDRYEWYMHVKHVYINSRTLNVR